MARRIEDESESEISNLDVDKKTKKSIESSSDDDSMSDGSSSDGSSDASSSDNSASNSDSASDSESDNQDSKRKRKDRGETRVSKKVRRFFEEEAGEGSEEEEESEDEDKKEKRDRDLERLRREMAQRKQAGTHRLKSVIERIEERARDEELQEGAGGTIVPAAEDLLEEYAGSEYSMDDQAGLMPGYADDKLFMVRVSEPGKERHAIAQLMSKAAEYVTLNRQVPVTSFFSVDSLRGFIYVEAPSDASVKDYVTGIRRLQNWSVRLVPRSEWLGIFKVAERHAEKKLELWQKGDWVRVGKRGGLYAGDAAQVYQDLGADQIEVILIPRLVSSQQKKDSTLRPVAAFFDPVAIESTKPGSTDRIRDPSTGEVFYNFQSERFTDKGYIVKRFNRNILVKEAETDLLDISAQTAHITNSEKSTFERKKVSTSQSSLEQLNRSHGQMYRVGDLVVATATDLKGVTGTIVSVDSAKFRVSVQIINQSKMASVPKLDFGFSEISKLFNPGDHVKIIGGPEQNETGIVTKATSQDKPGNSCFVVLDSSGLEVQVSSHLLTQTSEISKGEVTIDGITVGDLYEIRGGTPAVIVRVSKSGAVALAPHSAFFGSTSFDTMSASTSGPLGQAVSVSLAELSGKQIFVRKTAFAISREGDAFGSGSIVTAKPGNTFSIQGTVKFVHKTQVFIKVRDRTENAGFIVCQGKDCSVVVAAEQKASMLPSPPPRQGQNQSNPFSAAPNASNNSSAQTRPTGTNKFSAQDRLMGSRVRIIKGTYKGYTAAVRDVQDSKVQVSLEAKFKVITLPKDHIRSLEGEQDDMYDRSASGPAGNLHARPQPNMNDSRPQQMVTHSNGQPHTQPHTQQHQPSAMAMGPPRKFVEPKTPALEEFLPVDVDEEEYAPKPKTAVPVLPPRFGVSSLSSQIQSSAWLLPGAVASMNGQMVSVVRTESGAQVRVRTSAGERVLSVDSLLRVVPQVGERIKVVSQRSVFRGAVGELIGFQASASGHDDDAIVMVDGDIQVLAKDEVVPYQ